MTAYYNEHDPKAAATLREVIKEGLIAPGDVDERSIEDVTPAELMGYTQCHFFAGYGIWSFALRLTGWPDNREVWTGSCPCQPFSQAGKGKGFTDERHLWPAWFHLIQHGKRRGVPVYGEQVASPDGLAWLDLVWADMEAANHTVRPFDLCSAGFGAPIIRQRTFWVASASKQSGGWDSRGLHSAQSEVDSERVEDGSLADRFGISGDVSGLACSKHDGSYRAHSVTSEPYRDGENGRVFDGGCDLSWMDEPSSNRSEAGIPEPGQREEGFSEITNDASDGIMRMAGANGRITSYSLVQRGGEYGFLTEDGRVMRPVSEWACPTNGFWRNADWLRCRDDKWRPVEPGTFPLAHGYSERVGLLRGAGNAISPFVAAAFIQAHEESLRII